MHVFLASDPRHFNGDWRVDLNDAVTFMNSYVAKEGDLNGDGLTDAQDLVMFVQAFSEATQK